MKRYRIKANCKTTFASCGLDKSKNFLQAPICECGCGGYMNIILKTEQDLYDFINILLDDHECNHCAIFALQNGGTAVFGAKLEDGIQFYRLNNNGCNVKKIIAEMEIDFEFHCYGLLEQVEETIYKIVMD